MTNTTVEAAVVQLVDLSQTDLADDADAMIGDDFDDDLYGMEASVVVGGGDVGVDVGASCCGAQMNCNSLVVGGSLNSLWRLLTRRTDDMMLKCEDSSN